MNNDLQLPSHSSTPLDQMLGAWLTDLKSNRHATEDPALSPSHLEATARQFLFPILTAIRSNQLPQLDHQALDPVLKLWHDLVSDQAQRGVSTKSLAMLTLSLKTSLAHFLGSDSATLPEGDQATFQSLSAILDVLGLLSFELYSIEKDQLISRQQQQVKYLQSTQLAAQFGKLIGKSPEMEAVYRAIGMVLENDVTVLLEGETGTGKDLIASAIHFQSTRKSGPFITLNCGAIPKELIESELFGHEKGAFTGAIEQKLGKFELADGGSLFLDEIGELSLDLQVKLLRALQNREIERVGSTEKVKIDVRIIAATHRDLKALVAENQFRADLYYRIHVFPIHVPPLRDRKADILDLARYFIKTYAPKYNPQVKGLTRDAERFLLNHNWEGNVRELENLIQRAIILTPDTLISEATLTLKPGQLLKPSHAPASGNLALAAGSSDALSTGEVVPLEELERRAIEHAIQAKNGNMTAAAEALGVTRATLYNKLKKFKAT